MNSAPFLPFAEAAPPMKAKGPSLPSVVVPSMDGTGGVKQVDPTEVKCIALLATYCAAIHPIPSARIDPISTLMLCS